MPTDRDLAGARLTGAAYAAVLAARALIAEGLPVTVEAIADITGHGKTQVYGARRVLDRRFPDWRTTMALDTVPDQDVSGKPESTGALSLLGADLDVEDSGKPETPRSGPRLLGLIAAPETAPAIIGDVPIWRLALARVEAAHPAGRRSWDLYDDWYSTAWDAVLVAHDQDPAAAVGDLIGLAVNYLEIVDNGPLPTDARRLVALLVRQYGKAGLFGLKTAVGTTDGDSARDRYRYARQVAERVVADLRAREAAQ